MWTTSFVLGDARRYMLGMKSRIEHFLRERLQLELHPPNTVLQRCPQCVDFLGTIVLPHRRLTRQRSVRALNSRLAWIQGRAVCGQAPGDLHTPPSGAWQRWPGNHQALVAPGVPTQALLARMLATINSHYRVFSHANTWHLRQHIYHQQLEPLQRFFLPDGPDYLHLKIRKVWRM